MATTPTTSATSPTGAAGAGASSSLDSLNTTDFTNMLVAQLQNQDPTNPMTNSELMQQVSQIRSIGATDKLTSTLQSVLLGQSVATAGNLIGRSVKGQDSQGNPVAGTVSSVSISGGNASLNIGNSSIPLSNVTTILPTAAPAAAATSP